MTRDEALTIKADDVITPDPLWNQSERAYRQMNSEVRVLEVITRAGTQTGVMFAVESRSGKRLELDAGWFLSPEAA